MDSNNYRMIKDDIQTKYIKEDMEIRIDFVSVLLDNHMIVPIYYYSYLQECSYAYNFCTMDSDRMKDIDKDLLFVLVEELQKKVGARAVALSYANNMHTHPVGMKRFSSQDRNDGMLTNDFRNDYNMEFCGVNMLYSFNQDFYQALVRKKEGGKYKYIKIKETGTINFEPYDDIDVSHFKKANNKDTKTQNTKD